MPQPNGLGDFRYVKTTGNYWLQVQPDEYFEYDSREMKLHMRWHNMPVDKENEKRGCLKFGDQLLLQCQMMRAVDYAGPLAGHSTGILKYGGKSILVNCQSKPVDAVKGDWEFIGTFLIELLGKEQTQYFLLWLKMARESLLEGDFRPGQMIVLAGKSGCGKSFCHVLITEFLGGRMGKPFRYMTGGTQFNVDLAEAEHWVIADEKGSIDIRARREFGEQIKDATVNPEMSVHGKGLKATILPTYRRVSFSCNDEQENLMKLPPLDESLLDKIMLFKCSKANLGKNRKRNMRQLIKELPALAEYLERLQIPERLADDRYGVKAYHSPELLCAISGVSPEQRLIELIDEVLWGKKASRDKTFGDIGEWEGSAIELERELRASDFQVVVDRLLHFSSAAGVYLQRLAMKLPDRITSHKNAGKTYWRIKKG